MSQWTKGHRVETDRTGLSALSERYFRNLWDHAPTLGSRAGLQEFDGRLEAPSRDWIDVKGRIVAEGRAALAKLPLPDPGSPEELDRTVFDSHLSMTDLRLGALQSWRRDPSLPLTEVVESLFELLMRRDLDREDVASAIADRLGRLPAYLRAARSRLDSPVKLWVKVALESAPGAADFLRSAASQLCERHPKLAEKISRAGSAAAESVEHYGQWLTELLERPLDEDIACGPEVLSQMIRKWHGLNMAASEIEALGWNLIQYYAHELQEQVQRMDRSATWSGILSQARLNFAQQDGGMLARYRETTGMLKERMTRDGLLDLPPGEVCEVVATPSFLRPLLPTAAYSNPGPLDPRQVGIFFVTEPDGQLAGDAYRAQVGQHFGIEATCVHEAYPVHHVQLCWANRAGSLIRQMADHIIFMEGWTLYCEQWMIEGNWFDDPRLKLNYLVEQLWRAYRMVIDVGIHTRSLSVEAAIQMLIDGVGFTRERATSELNWYTQSPGVPMSYLLGKRETLALRDSFLAAPGANLARFHRWLLGFGSLPQRWLALHLPAGADR